MAKKTIERQVSESILQQKQNVVISGKKYRYHKPTTAALIAASAAISELPHEVLNSENTLSEALRVARFTRPIGEAIAIMLVSAKGSMHAGILHFFWRLRVRRKATYLLENCSNDDLMQLAMTLFSNQHIASFFGLTAFLCEVNLTKPTKAGTTAFGQR